MLFGPVILFVTMWISQACAQTPQLSGTRALGLRPSKLLGLVLRHFKSLRWFCFFRQLSSAHHNTGPKSSLKFRLQKCKFMEYWALRVNEGKSRYVKENWLRYLDYCFLSICNNRFGQRKYPTYSKQWG